MTFTKGELVILQLNRFGDKMFDRFDMPYGMTQDGIGTALCISRAHASIELKKLRNKGLVAVIQAHVMHRPKVMNVYILTSDGRRLALDLVKRAKENSLDLEEMFTVRPMRKALNSTPPLIRAEIELRNTLEYIEEIRTAKRAEKFYPIYMYLMEAQRILYQSEVEE